MKNNDIIKILKAVYDNAHDIVKKDEDAEFWVSQEFYDGYQKYLQTGGKVIINNIKVIEGRSFDA